MTLDSEARAPALATAPIQEERGTLPYTPSWIHPLSDAIDRLPGPRWIAYAGIAIVGIVLQHAQLWSTGRVEVGTLDRVQAYWGLVIGAVFWLPGYLERSARANFERFRPALELSREASDRLGFELTIIPGRMSLAITALAALATVGAIIGDPEGSSFAGLPPLMLALAFVIQTAVAAVLLQVIYRLVRQVRLVREILERHVEVDLFRPGPLHAIAGLTARPGALLTLLLATVVLVVPFSTEPVAFLVAWAPVLLAPPLIAIVAFVAPLTGAHRRLEAQKDRLQDATELRIRSLLDDLDRDVDARDLARADAYSKTLATLLVERDILAKLPTWPWSTATLRAFFTTILLPLALFLLQQVLSRLLAG
jgi:hypothetical protein